ncbi:MULTISPECIES: asparagine synthase (glutamine-hydrolyzing) [Streptomyces]|uniref:asparagine synthase (glutamine-hydrolyzing) n=1 Tax=Streptomyces koelreuteriae TaxID=2838015 RepID=A0ABX8FM54_9ACTN|nr:MULTISPECIES: asparagine synthase (glutamine-hydrolyzing) [Streptomyces]QWB22137.1 asparagine synthase (glutamine-hydrolyzing) [Streptomyces koelreuteriae]UUA05076.1 asparagine synthase (glutamine-hydrolyzing) [Streptomyces koelreuteriae]UUA12700.1 asparagine synthase (glutamine-hydrolyzing) [Streptomyces sp. CRCS-T-1]
MCGITGWVSFDRDLTQQRTQLDAMTRTMACRGPDAGGAWLDRHAALGHRRLAVIDLEGGTQPMVVPTDDGPVAITYSGEVYNYLELRSELLRRGHRFETRSDTEVVLHGYVEWGEAVAERLNGMFAFAVWDSRIEKLVMIRDRMGVKPLYYAGTDDGVLFGSEPKAILANALADRAVDLDGLRELVSFTQTPGSAVWCGMHEVVPGGVVTVDRSGLRERRYWTLPTRPHTDDLKTTVATVRELLEDIVSRQLVSDVPRCTLLSGGLDSSAITALAAAKLGRPGEHGEAGEKVRSFAVDFVGREDDFVADDLRATTDAPYALEVAAHVGSQHEAIVLDHAAIADPAVRRAVITARDSPLSLGDMDGSLYLLFQAIRQQSTVALSGESADEVFGGYRWFHQPEVQAARTFPWMAVFVSGARAQVSDRFNPAITAALDLPSYIRDRYSDAVAEVERGEGESDHEMRMREMTYLHLTRFVRMLLERKDRISMAVGLEVRVPFCDHRLVEYVYNTPWSLKTFDGREKSLLRAATADLLPRSVLERVKAPYPATLDPHYTSSLLQQSKELLTTDDPVFDLVDRSWLEDITRQDSATMPIDVRNGMERVLDLSTWLDIYRPELRL